jgi:3-phenylpropionate/trans-cinnamate dioxygenase ferredoxin reductase subunit
LSGRVEAAEEIGEDVLELTLSLARTFPCLPGQHCRFTFKGYPERAFSPTVALDGADWEGSMRLHVRRREGGAVSSALGKEIVAGHRLRVTGPFGSAFLRRGRAGRLALFASGTGFAPIWSIADAALREDATRPMLLVAGVRSLPAFYFGAALNRMAQCPNVEIVAMTRIWQGEASAVRQGSPSDCLPLIRPDDTVYAAGPPDLVEEIARGAAEVGAVFHADPFLDSTEPIPRWRTGFTPRRWRLGSCADVLRSHLRRGAQCKTGPFR